MAFTVVTSRDRPDLVEAAAEAFRQRWPEFIFHDHWAANAVLEIPTMLAYRRLAGRLRVQWLLVAGASIFVLRASLFAISGSPVGLVVGAALGGIGFALFLVGTTTFVARRAPASLRATAQALFTSTAYAIGSIIGGILAGLVAGSWGLATVFPAAAVTSAVGAVMIWLAVIRRDVPVPAADSQAQPAAPAG